MRMYDLIHKKRQGGKLNAAEIQEMIRSYTAGEIPDYQMAAFAMAVFFQGMDDTETAALTDAMARSGDMVDLSRFGTRSVDKHSTGGVGDKTTLVVAPVAAALGGVVAKMTGRGLGHTGGTADKLESIPGFRTEMAPEQFMEQAAKIGIAVVSQTANLAPADKKLYALRDVTATVDNMALICSSVMSKKIAAGAHAIVLDVKTGSGAFMKTPEAAAALARKMVDIGTACSRKVAALITDMNTPLGYAIGNALEVREAIEVLQGHGPADLTEVCVALAANMVALSRDWGLAESETQVRAALADGRALEKFRAWVAAQGGDPAVVDTPALLPQASVAAPVYAPRDGYIAETDAEAIGMASVALGAGRATKEDRIDPAAGILLLAKRGDFIKRGDTLAQLYTGDAGRLAEAERLLLNALQWSDTAPAARPLIYAAIRN